MNKNEILNLTADAMRERFFKPAKESIWMPVLIEALEFIQKEQCPRMIFRPAGGWERGVREKVADELRSRGFTVYENLSTANGNFDFNLFISFQP